MHSVWRPWTKSWRLYLALAAITAAMALFAYRTYCAIEQDLTAAAISGRTSIPVLAASNLTQEFQRLIDVGRALGSRVRFGELIAAGRWQEAAHIMATVPRDFSAIEQVLVIDANGTVRATIPQSDSAASASMAQRNWYRDAIATQRPTISNVQTLNDVEGHTVFFVAIPIFNASGKVDAVLAMIFDTRHFSTLFAQLHLEPEAAIHVIDRRGRRAFDSAALGATQVSDFSADPIVQRMLRGETGVAIDNAGMPDSEHAKNTLYVSTYAPASFGWGVVTQWPHDTVFATRDEELHRVIVGTAIIAIITIIAVALLIQVVVERKQTEDERRANMQLESRVQERTAQLENMNRELESFSYSVSHDLRAPLRAIDGFSTLLIEEHGASLGATAKRYVDSVHRNVVHMARLIDELLELSRVGRVALEYRQVDMNALVQEVLPEILTERPTAKVNVTALPPVRGDATLIRQIWVNLIDNAAKYSCHATAPQIDISCSLEKDEAIFRVSDNGVGFDMTHYDRLFKPFSRLHSPGEFAGTGVGLAIVKRIVERHDGRVWADSIANQGTTILFSLPHRS